MPRLNLPPYQAKIKIVDGKPKVLDILRRRFVALTPEEWVRQNFVNYLISYKGYSSALMNNEVMLSFNGMTRRCDSVLYTNTLVPKMIIEYKAPNIGITQKVFDQICRYNMVLHVEYLIISNGMNHYCCKINYESQTYTFLEEIPLYEEL
ncbi:MAG: type I restriction enzyme HsdR N-terminal domain-containing protein [Bacteroides sp.]|nr:type I restriction enzyme HsdR N-terminal domain-containing protein [Bacteroides sp.]MCM1420503.1 type I restriction enzyme HsdR N-terminal domain-containing protein [Bacteroides sp.]